MIVLSILLIILKWIGIILLSLLGLVLFLLVVILFVPIKYKISSNYLNDNKYFKVNISWILNIIRFGFEYNIKDSKLDYSLKFLFFLIFGSNKKVKLKKEKSKKYKHEKDTPKEYKYENLKNENDFKSTIDRDELEEKKLEHKAFKKKTFKQKLKGVPVKLQKIKEKIENKKYTINNLYDKIKNKINNFRRWKDFLTHRISKRAYEHIKLCLKKLWRSVRPKRWNLYLEFGFEDIATTGKGLAFMSAFLPTIKGNINVIPNFQEKVFLLDSDLYGHIRLISLLICFIKIYKNKDVKKTYNQYKKMK